MPMLSWRHHTLIQSLLSRGPLKEDDFCLMFSQITKTSGPHIQKTLNEYLRKINEELSYVQFELRACRNQYDGNVYYGVVNNVPDNLSKLGTKYSIPQIAFFKGAVEAIIHDAEAKGSISNTDALYVRLEMQVQGGTNSQSQGGASQVPTALKNFSMTQKEKTLEQLVKDNWLCSMPDGKIGLGVRSFLDLRSWFRSNEVPACQMCNEAAIKAQLCQKEDCDVRLHEYCLKKKFSEKNAGRGCPGCGTEWASFVVKGEAVEEEDNDEPNLPSQHNSQPSQRNTQRKRQRSQQEADAGGSDDYSTQTATTKRVTRRSSRFH